MYKPTIAVVGLNGAIGKHTINALLSPAFKSLYTLPIRAVTRDSAKAQASAPSTASTDDLKFYTADVATGEGLDTAFEGADVVINLLGAGVAHGKVAEAAATAKAKLYIPSEFGTDIVNAGPYSSVFQAKINNLKYAKSLGLKTVAIINGAFSEWALNIPPLVGVNFPETGKFQYYGDLDTKISTTSLADVGKVVASLASKDPSTIPDEIKVASEIISPRIVHSTFKKVTGQDLTQVGAPLEDITTPALKVAKEGVKSPADFVAGLRGVVYSGNMYHDPIDNEFVSKGLFEFTPFEKVAETVIKK